MAVLPASGRLGSARWETTGDTYPPHEKETCCRNEAHTNGIESPSERRRCKRATDLGYGGTEAVTLAFKNAERTLGGGDIIIVEPSSNAELDRLANANIKDLGGSMTGGMTVSQNLLGCQVEWQEYRTEDIKKIG